MKRTVKNTVVSGLSRLPIELSEFLAQKYEFKKVVIPYFEKAVETGHGGISEIILIAFC